MTIFQPKHVIYCITVFFIPLFFLPQTVVGSPRVWVFFSDKSGSEVLDSINSLHSNWPERSFNRRLKNGVGFTSADLPVNSAYIEQIRATGANVTRVSRWLNAVSAEISEDKMDLIRSFDCVSSIQPVRMLKIDGMEEIDFTEIGDNDYLMDDTPPSGAIPPGGYGYSRRQAEQAGVIEAHRRGLTGRGVLIGFLDTGFQLDHRALAGMRLIGQFDFIFNDSDPSWDPLTDPRGQASHGTACLSVVAGYEPGQLVGIAPNADFALAKTEHTGSETAVEEDYWVAGLEWLEWLGADVVSSSLTYRDWYRAADYDGAIPLVSRAAERAVDLGMIICNSAGNNGPEPLTIGAPADARGVLAVAAVDSNGVITRFSSRGPTSDGRIKPDISAMGRGVVCVSPMSWSRYARWNGTSLACPIVAGVAALVIEAHPEWSAAKVREALIQTASQAFYPDNIYGYGIVDCGEAVAWPAVSGRVRFRQSLPDEVIPILSLQLTGNSGIVYPAVFSRDGWFRVANLPEGFYSLTIHRDGQMIFMREGMQLPPSLSFEIVLD